MTSERCAGAKSLERGLTPDMGNVPPKILLRGLLPQVWGSGSTFVFVHGEPDYSVAL